MKTLRTILIDDEPLCRQDLRDLLSRFAEVRVLGEASSLAQARQLLHKFQVDLIFLDLALAHENGFDLLRQVQFPGMVIAVTAFSGHAVAGFECGMIDYLVKPVPLARLRTSIQRAKKQLRSTQNNRPTAKILAEITGKKALLELDDIVQIQSMGNYVVLHTSLGKGVVRSSLRGIILQFPPDALICLSRGCWVAREHIAGWERKINGVLQVFLRDQSVLPVSRRHNAEVIHSVRQMINKHVSN